MFISVCSRNGCSYVQKTAAAFLVTLEYCWYKQVQWFTSKGCPGVGDSLSSPTSFSALPAAIPSGVWDAWFFYCVVINPLTFVILNGMWMCSLLLGWVQGAEMPVVAVWGPFSSAEVLFSCTRSGVIPERPVFLAFAHAKWLALIFISWVLIPVWHVNILRAEIEVYIKVK